MRPLSLIAQTYDAQIEWIRKIHHAIGSPLVDFFFFGMGYVDSFAFVLLVVLATWWLIDRKIGVSLVYLFLLSSIVNVFIKELFALPRPCQIDPSVGLICLHSFGLPSGAAQSAVLYVGVVYKESKNLLFRCLALMFALLLCFSRIYLGVHFVTDIIGGIVIGSCLLLGYWFLFDRLRKHWKRWAFVVALFPLILLQKKGVGFSMTLIGIGMGLLLYDWLQPKEPKHWAARWGQMLSTLLGVLALHEGARAFANAAPLFTLFSGIWLSFLGGWLCIRNRW